MADTSVQDKKATKKTTKKETSDETKKRKNPAKDEGSGQIRRSSRIQKQQKSERAYREDSDEEDYDPKPKKSSPKKRAPAKKKKADDSDDSANEEEKDKASEKKEKKTKQDSKEALPPSSLGMSSDSTQPMSLTSFQLPSQPSQSQSQDGMSLLTKAYGEVQSLETSIQTYEHSKSYFQPLGKISKQQLHEAEKVLNDIKNILEEEAKKKESDPNFTRSEDVNKKLRMLTNHFYNYIPSQDQTNLPSINSEVMLKEKFALLQALEGKHGK